MRPRFRDNNGPATARNRIPGPLPGNELRRRTIRGSQTAATLKQCSLCDACICSLIYPRFPNRGHIEAQRAGLAGREGFDYPRFPNRGHIEARSIR